MVHHQKLATSHCFVNLCHLNLLRFLRSSPQREVRASQNQMAFEKETVKPCLQLERQKLASREPKSALHQVVSELNHNQSEVFEVAGRKT